MIRADNVSDTNNAVSLYKIQNNGQFAAGITLTGFGTHPIPGAVTTNAVEKAVHFAANNIQEIMDLLLSKKCDDMEQAQYLLLQQMRKTSANITKINRSIGQGTYIAGAVCYIAKKRFICLPFGGGYACLYDGDHVIPLHNNALQKNLPTGYIWDAIGGAAGWKAAFTEGTMPIGSQMILMTETPPEALLQSAVTTYANADPARVATSIYDGLQGSRTQKAVLTLTRTVDILQQTEVGGYDE